MRTTLSAMFVSAMLLAAPSGAFAAGGYIQASSEEDQIAKDTKPQMITMASTDAAMMRHETLNYHPLRNTMTTSIGRDDLVRFLTATGHPPRILAVADGPQTGL